MAEGASLFRPTFFALGLAFAFAAAPRAACAEITLNDYDKYMSEPDTQLLMQEYLGGLVEGLLAGNAWDIFKGQEPAYCLPGNLSLQTAQAISILDNYVASQHPPKTNELGLVMMNALQSVFPCTQ